MEHMSLLMQNRFSKPWSGRECQIICGFGSPTQLGKYFHLHFFQQCDSSSALVLFCFTGLFTGLPQHVLLSSSLLAHHSEPHGFMQDLSSWPFQWARRGLHKPLWLFTAKPTTQNSGENSSSSINKDNAGRRQVLVFIPGNIIKGSREENTCFCHAFIICSLNLILCWWFCQ